MTDSTAPKAAAARPEGASLADWMETRIARLSTRTTDWDALKFQADFDPVYRRAQMRYVGTGGTGVTSDSNTVPAEHFTFSTMLMPAGSRGPMHIHVDVEEVFFILEGSKVRVLFEHEGETWDALLGKRDLISVPAGIYREVRNDGEDDALVCTLLGAAKPVRPTYPADHPLTKIRQEKQGT